MKTSQKVIISLIVLMGLACFGLSVDPWLSERYSVAASFVLSGLAFLVNAKTMSLNFAWLNRSRP